MTTELGVGVIGLGFMGQTHVTALTKARASGLSARLVAICDRHEERRRGEPSGQGNLETVGSELLFDPRVVRGYARPEELIADPEVEAVSICTHTPTHVEIGVAALEAGKHILVEKPVALDRSEVVRLREAAHRSRCVAMPAMVMRFWPGWDWLREAIDDRRYGAVESAHFSRVGPAPNWSREFYGDPSASGGALGDLHIHDADFVRWVFGMPSQVITQGTLDRMTTIYRFDEGPREVVAEAGWIREPSFPFRMRYEVIFERAVARWDLAREIPLEV
ncbi:MAG: Gfo/Idh/MocA family oxidoreductase, partial [Planctomycetes bacterium]|nr:Gfo/Idh/MocA family oxidoreductase [Planctomycetota bacterium]